MNFKHAVGFLAVGTLCGLLPRLVPGWFEATGTDGSSARALWLLVMSWVQIGIAATYFAQRAMAAAAVILAHGMQQGTLEAAQVEVPFDESEIAPLPRRPMPARLRERKVIPMPAVLKTGLLDQPRAA